MLRWKFGAMGIFFFGEHDDGRFWKAELVDEEVLHALGVVDASLELVSREAVGDADDDGLLAAVGVGRGRRVAVGRGRRRRRVGGGRWLRREGAWIADESDSAAEGAADGSRARWQLQRGAAVGAVDQHVAVHRR